MLFVANVLELNGGTTFILRLAREFKKRNKKVGVLVLFDIVNKGLEKEILQYADIYNLKNFAPKLVRATFRSQLGGFMPVDFSKIERLIVRYNSHVHVMGVFGLIFVKRYLTKTQIPIMLSIGIYHQNEIMFDKVSFYFALKAKQMFTQLPAECLVFFNEKNRESFSHFFGKSYSNSTLVPIGIDIPSVDVGLTGAANSSRIVSIGNLHVFKSYNRHIISLLPELKKIKSDLVYEIYGAGQNEAELRKLVTSLGLESSVFFNGVIAYDKIPTVLAGALAFVGSGTAIVEASALGVPSIIGIESTDNPITYGFLSDIQGFSYNEMNSDQIVFPILEKLASILSDAYAWRTAAMSCKDKAQFFSIVHTAEGFLKLEEKKINLQLFTSDNYSNVMSAVSFISCAVQSKLKLDEEFINRRNQGTLV